MNQSDYQSKTKSEPFQVIGKNLNYFKTQASKLHKQIKQADLILDSELNNRLSRSGQEQLLEAPEKVKRKHVLNIINTIRKYVLSTIHSDWENVCLWMKLVFAAQLALSFLHWHETNSKV